MIFGAAGLLAVTVVDPAGHPIPTSVVILPKVGYERCVPLDTGTVEWGYKRGSSVAVRAWAEGYAPVDRQVRVASRTNVTITLHPVEGGVAVPYLWNGCRAGADSFVNLEAPYAASLELNERDAGTTHVVTSAYLLVDVELALRETGAWSAPRVDGPFNLLSSGWPIRGKWWFNFTPLSYGDYVLSADLLAPGGAVLETWSSTVTLVAPKL